MAVITTSTPRSGRQPEPLDRLLKRLRQIRLEVGNILALQRTQRHEFAVVNHSNHVVAVEIGTVGLLTLEASRSRPRSAPKYPILDLGVGG